MKFALGLLFLVNSFTAQAQNQLAIPPTLTGTTFNLNIQSGTQTFYSNISTPTYGINSSWMAPTIIVNKDDSVAFNVTNNLNVSTTIHWHGFHVAAINDGGPHQKINPNGTWSPSFKVRNNASTYWYHPHGIAQTEQQISKGLAGMLIVKDSTEALLPLPRTYGVDDIPIIVQSKAFDVLTQIAIASDLDTALFINGTVNPYFLAPAQVIRFRLLNASSLRTYNFGFSNGQTFYQIATDGGLLDSSIALTRLKISPGERAEILIDFSGMTSQMLFLKSYSSELPNGIYGANTVGSGADTINEYNDNFLNGSDFNLLQINVVATVGTPITTIPAALIPFTPINPLSATNYRTIVMDTIRLLPIDPPNRAEGPFGLNNKTFDIDSINETVYLNTTEIWTLKNQTLVAHPFHIHDVEFNIIEKGGLPPTASERGWKDVVLVLPGDSVKFITQFADFADDMVPYMYHCHLLHHEDDGMMGSFLVLDTAATGIEEINIENNFSVFPNPTMDRVNIVSRDNRVFQLEIFNAFGKMVYSGVESSIFQIETASLSSGIYFIKMNSDKNIYTGKFIKS